MIHRTVGGEVSLHPSQKELRQNNRRRLRAEFRKDILGANCNETFIWTKHTIERGMVQYLDLVAHKHTRPRYSVMLSCQACVVSSLHCGYADEVGPGPTAALIGQAVGSTVSSSKWRHVRPVRLQLGPGCFPEALEASPCLSAHRGGWTVHPTVSGPDLSCYETNLYLLWAHAGKEYRHKCKTGRWMFSR